MAYTHVLDYVNAWSGDPQDSLRIGLETAQRAVAMSGDEPIAHFALGMACLWSSATRPGKGGS